MNRLVCRKAMEHGLFGWPVLCVEPRCLAVQIRHGKPMRRQLPLQEVLEQVLIPVLALADLLYEQTIVV